MLAVNAQRHSSQITTRPRVEQYASVVTQQRITRIITRNTFGLKSPIELPDSGAKFSSANYYSDAVIDRLDSLLQSRVSKPDARSFLWARLDRIISIMNYNALPSPYPKAQLLMRWWRHWITLPLHYVLKTGWPPLSYWCALLSRQGYKITDFALPTSDPRSLKDKTTNFAKMSTSRTLTPTISAPCKCEASCYCFLWGLRMKATQTLRRNVALELIRSNYQVPITKRYCERQWSLNDSCKS